ncbi:AAA family ATPase [Pseudoalteromonas sp. BSi20429]|uniref:AAA family ATPase n=1 Tax=Pseudoalteromonas sp. BSi20429 TaxID=1097676 RepID=UPI0002316716|nr:AAA family ATPase [Pseudoalteromonas sp. BSi20429]GAA69179.1 5-methylcytosine-specific restriction enzyme B [Pseudoalteromonas sp. BSi20429]
MEFEEFLAICMDDNSKEFLLSKSDKHKKLFFDSFNLIREYFPQCDCYTINSKQDSYKYAFRFGVKASKESDGTPQITIKFTKNALRVSLKKGVVQDENRVLNLETIDQLRSFLDSIKSKLRHKMEGSKNTPINYFKSEKGSDMVITNDTDKCTNEMQPSPLNQILYGPPGTGKTYHTIEASVRAAEPEKYEALKRNPALSTAKSQREELIKLYKSLVDDDRIRFVTFHQSYGYEEFVEGLRALTNEEKQIEYKVLPGIFKKISDDAANTNIKKSLELNANPRIWKISIDGVKPSTIKNYCFENKVAAIGWGHTGDMAQDERSPEENAYFEGLTSQNKNTITQFCSAINEGDLLLCISSAKTIQAVGVVKGDYEYKEQGILDRNDFRHTLPVEWLKTDLDLDIYSLNGNTNLVQKTVYELDRFTEADFFQLMEKNEISFGQKPVPETKDNYVLIIDEINRGNISKIFGELITLIEPSKREGKNNLETLKVTLPHSGNPFSVPDNLYIIGTMNTADRSLAMMDTALRRRFDFIEMMPQPELFKGKKVKGIELELLLKTMNKRIEVLYDREHTLGHAFLIPVLNALDSGEDDAEASAFTELKSTFKNKIIPLLEEYFFEDWNKIRLVLGDNRKEKSELEQYIFVESKNEKYNDIFGENHGLETYEDTKTTFTLADFNAQDSAWNDPIAYQAIYDDTLLKSPTSISADAGEVTASSAQ